MHVLDLIMLPVTMQILWWVLRIISGGDLTEEMGVLIGWMIEVIWIIIYCILFFFVDYNWIDIYNWIGVGGWHTTFKL